MHWITNKLADLKKQYVNELTAFYDNNEAESLINILIRFFFGLSRTGLITKPDFRLNESEILKLHFAVKELKNHRPVQYIIGETEFLGLKIKVNESVLIPRPETEELVQLIINSEKKEDLQILDMGTGSGCIAVALKKNLPNAELTGIDISKKALRLAAQNAEQNNVNIDFREVNILEQNTLNTLGQYHVIVSNPPYVTQTEKGQMEPNVLRHEPHEALFVADDNALVFYETIFEFAKSHLYPSGSFYVEVNEAKGMLVAQLAEKKGFDMVKIHKDIHGKQRFISGLKND